MFIRGKYVFVFYLWYSEQISCVSRKVNLASTKKTSFGHIVRDSSSSSLQSQFSDKALVDERREAQRYVQTAIANGNDTVRGRHINYKTCACIAEISNSFSLSGSYPSNPGSASAPHGWLHLRRIYIHANEILFPVPSKRDVSF